MKKYIRKIQAYFWSHLMQTYNLREAKKVNRGKKQEGNYSSKHIRVLKTLMLIYNRQQEYQMHQPVSFRKRKDKGIVSDMRTIKNYMHVVSQTALPSDYVIRQILLRLHEDGIIHIEWVGHINRQRNRYYRFNAHLNKGFKAKWSWNK